MPCLRATSATATPDPTPIPASTGIGVWADTISICRAAAGSLAITRSLRAFLHLRELDRFPGHESPSIHNAELQQLVHDVDELPDREQQALIVVIDGLVKSAPVSRIVSRRAGAKRIPGRARGQTTRSTSVSALVDR